MCYHGTASQHALMHSLMLQSSAVSIAAPRPRFALQMQAALALATTRLVT